MGLKKQLLGDNSKLFKVCGISGLGRWGIWIEALL